MSQAQVPDRETYEQTDPSSRAFTYRDRWPIASPPPEWERSDEPTVKPGDLVAFKVHPDDGLAEGWYTPIWRNKRIGLVLMTRWVLADWMRHDKKEPKLYPEALILWGDGETTNTSQSCLKVFE